MPQLAIIDYAAGKIEITNLSEETLRKYSSNFGALVYEVLGYRQPEIYYMASENEIEVSSNEETI